MVNVSEKLPVVKHLYQNYMMDTLRWNFLTPRADDVVVATTYKAGTTWVQTIVANLIFGSRNSRGRSTILRRGSTSACFHLSWC